MRRTFLFAVRDLVSIVVFAAAGLVLVLTAAVALFYLCLHLIAGLFW